MLFGLAIMVLASTCSTSFTPQLNPTAFLACTTSAGRKLGWEEKAEPYTPSSDRSMRGGRNLVQTGYGRGDLPAVGAPIPGGFMKKGTKHRPHPFSYARSAQRLGLLEALLLGIGSPHSKPQQTNSTKHKDSPQDTRPPSTLAACLAQ